MTREEAKRIYIEEKAYKRGYEDAKKELDRPHGEWIPCSERLPEDEGKYLVSLNYGDVTMDSFIDGMFIMNLINVVAWMPLPEPYKGGDVE